MLGKDLPSYPVSTIPEELLKNANAVIRNSECTFEIISETKAKETINYAITILKEGAIDKASLSIFYNKILKVSGIEGTVYDASGKKVKKIKADEILDISAIDGATLFSENRIKRIDPKYYSYPFTVEYSYTLEYGTLFFMPRWNAFTDYNISVEKTSFRAIAPNTYKLRYYEKNTQVKIEKADATNTTSYSWSSEKIMATNPEPMSPFISELYPLVKLAPSVFELEGQKGTLETWNELALFMGKLIEGRDQIPEQTQNEIKSLIKDTSDKKEIIRRIYEYAQKKNRYISIQVGIGGWQPFDANTVDRLSYGDCKALSNYTLSLLKVAGIKSHYTGVYAGTTPYSTSPDFPLNAFNHIILGVPLEQDTIWLECTNSNSPCGYIGSFTDDRYVLIAGENGGKLVKTPCYTALQNSQSTTGTIQIKEEGTLQIAASTSFFGTNYEDMSQLLYVDEKDRRKKIINSIRIPNFNLINYSLTDNRDHAPSIRKNIEVEATNYWTQMGDKVFLKLNLLNTFESIPPAVRNRQSPLHIKRNYSESDTLTYQLPEKMSVIALPEASEIKTEFGYYSSSAKMEGNKIIYNRYFQINKGSYPKEQYEPFREFLEKIAVADNAKTILRKDS